MRRLIALSLCVQAAVASARGSIDTVYQGIVKTSQVADLDDKGFVMIRAAVSIGGSPLNVSIPASIELQDGKLRAMGAMLIQSKTRPGKDSWVTLNRDSTPGIPVRCKKANLAKASGCDQVEVTAGSQFFLVRLSRRQL